MDPRDLYLLQDGTHADPADVSADKAGILRHKGGLAVCLYEDGTPQTVGKDAAVNKNVEAANAGKDVAAKQNEPSGGPLVPAASDVKGNTPAREPRA